MSLVNLRVGPVRVRFPQRWLLAGLPERAPCAAAPRSVPAASTRSGTGEQEPRARSRRCSLSPGASVYTDLTVAAAAAAVVYLYARSPRTVFFL